MMMMMNGKMKRNHPTHRARRRTQIFTLSIPIIYSIWLAVTNMWAIDRSSAQNASILTSLPLVAKSSSQQNNEGTQRAIRTVHDLAAAEANCFPFNSDSWLRGPRLGNANESSGVNYPFGKELISSSVHWSLDNLSTLFQKSICTRNSRFVHDEPTGDAETKSRLWVVRLVYMYLHYHQHRYAFLEAQSLEPHCLLERQAAGIGPFDYECANAKFLVVRFYNNGIGANMRYSAVPSLMAGLATDRIVLFVNHSPVGPQFLQQSWSQVTCDRRDAQCFFLPTSPCVLTHEEIEQAYSLRKKERRNLFRTGTLPVDRNEDRVLLLQLPFRAQRIPENLRDKIYTGILPLLHNITEDLDLQQKLLDAADQIRKDDIVLRNESFSYYGMNSPLYHGLLLYALRPNPRAVNRMDEIVNAIIPPEFESGESIGLPIRASDKCDVEMECMSFKDHLDAAQESWRTLNISQSQQPFIVLTTESKKIKEEIIQSLTRTNATDFAPIPVMNHFDITQDTGYFEPLLSGSTDNQTDGAILSAMSSLKLQLFPQLTLGNCCSSFHLMLKDILSEGCGAHRGHSFQCLQTHENPRFRVCCSWDKSPYCVARREKAR